MAAERKKSPRSTGISAWDIIITVQNNTQSQVIDRDGPAKNGTADG
jgi:hypothetical protein